MTRERKLREVLNVRLDLPLAREIRRIAHDRGSSESETARLLLSYGVEVQRRLDSERFSKSLEAEQREQEEPGFLEIEARWRPATTEELIEIGYIKLQDEEPEDGGSGS